MHLYRNYTVQNPWNPRQEQCSTLSSAELFFSPRHYCPLIFCRVETCLYPECFCSADDRRYSPWTRCPATIFSVWSIHLFSCALGDVHLLFSSPIQLLSSGSSYAHFDCLRRRQLNFSICPSFGIQISVWLRQLSGGLSEHSGE